MSETGENSWVELACRSCLIRIVSHVYGESRITNHEKHALSSISRSLTKAFTRFSIDSSEMLSVGLTSFIAPDNNEES